MQCKQLHSFRLLQSSLRGGMPAGPPRGYSKQVSQQTHDRLSSGSDHTAVMRGIDVSWTWLSDCRRCHATKSQLSCTPQHACERTLLGHNLRSSRCAVSFLHRLLDEPR